jgi:hypothetical protein
MGAFARRRRAIKPLPAILVVALTACSPAPAPVAAPPPAASTAAATRAPFADTVWRVESSTAVAPGTLYAFLADGTLVISAPQQTTSYGRWTYANGALVMIEEGIAYPTEILAFDGTKLSIRSHNPGTPVDIVLVAANDVALPQAPAK